MKNIGRMLTVWGGVAVLGAGCAEKRPVVADSLMFDASPMWQLESPSHPSRRLEFRLPSNDAQREDARLVVWNFPDVRDPGNGEMIQKTMDRWCTQIVQRDGTPSQAAADRTEYAINNMPVSVMDVTGRYVAETAPGSGIHYNKPLFRMVGAYIVTPDADYMVQLVGPASVVADHSGEFDQFLKSVRRRDPAVTNANAGWPPQRRVELTATRN